jgi:hypothetical protein
LKTENHQLKTSRDEQNQNLAELTDSYKESVSRAAEADTLRTEITNLHSDLANAQAGFSEALSNLSLAQLSQRDDSTAAPAPGIHDHKWPVKTVTNTPPSNSPHLIPGVVATLRQDSSDLAPAYAAHGTVDGIKIVNVLTQESASSGPTWSISEPLPLSFTSAEEIARTELRRFLQDEPSWQVERIQLTKSDERMNRSRERIQRWHYTLGFRSRNPFDDDHIAVSVSMDGTCAATFLATGRY